MHSKCCASVGLSTPLAVITLPPLSCRDPSLSASNLLVINTILVMPSSRNLHIARKFLIMGRISSITFAPLAIALKSTATSFILFGFGTADDFTILATPSVHCGCVLHSLQMVVAIVIPDHDGKCVKSFTTSLKLAGWCLSLTDTSFPTHVNTILGLCCIIIGIHSSCSPTVEPLHLKSPPLSIPCPLGLSLWEPFNRTEHSVLLAMDNNDFMRQDVKFTATLPPSTFLSPPGVSLKYFLHGCHSDKSMLADAAVISSGGLCPPFDVSSNKNLFQHLFSIEFNYDNHSCVCGNLPFEFAPHCFGFVNDLTY